MKVLSFTVIKKIISGDRTKETLGRTSVEMERSRTQGGGDGTKQRNIFSVSRVALFHLQIILLKNHNLDIEFIYYKCTVY